jgi:flagellar basal body-associated protein FliL
VIPTSSPPPGGVPFTLPGTPGVPIAPTRARKGMPRSAWIAIIVGIVIIVLAVAVVGIIIAFVISEVSKPADVANTFMKDVQSDDAQAAWDLMTAKGKAAQSYTDFKTAISSLSGTISSYYTRQITISNGQAKISMLVKSNDGKSSTWTFYLEKQNGNWKIQRVDF